MESNWGIIGHERAVELISERLARGRISHAYLLAGPQGIGKTLFATRLAQAINCIGDNPPCGECRACELIGRGQHPDFHILEPENDKIRIEAIRDLQNVVAMRPFEARYRVALINRFDRATESAMDALLKTLEEPPSMSKIIITADVGEMLLPTIVSRCQVIPLRPVPAAQIEAALRERFDLPQEQAGALARLSGGRPGWAINAAQNPESYAEHSQIIDTLIGLLQSGRVIRFNYAEELARYDKLRETLEIWQSWWRDVMLLAERSQVVLVHTDRIADLEMIADQAGSEAARRALIAVRDAIQYLGRNANSRLTLEVMFLEMPYLH
jgi:DNA polymerase III subunit delta'